MERRLLTSARHSAQLPSSTIFYNRDVLESVGVHKMGFGVPYSVFQSNDLPSDRSLISRFVSISAFERMIDCGISFTRADLFADPLDATVPIASRGEQIVDVEHMRRGYAISCWTLNYRANDPELLLREFTLLDQNGGAERECCITIDIERFIASVGWDDSRNLRGPILYCNPETFDVVQSGLFHRAFFWKTTDYIWENEYRFVFNPNGGYGGDWQELAPYTYLPFDWRRSLAWIFPRPGLSDERRLLLNSLCKRHDLLCY